MLSNIMFALLILCFIGIVFSGGVLYGFHTYRAIEDESLKERIKIHEDYIKEADRCYKRNMKILEEAKNHLKTAQDLHDEITKVYYGNT